MPRPTGSHNFDGEIFLGGSDPSRAEVPDNDYREMPAFPLEHATETSRRAGMVVDNYAPKGTEADDMALRTDMSRRYPVTESNKQERHNAANRAVDHYAGAGDVASKEYQETRNENLTTLAKNVPSNPVTGALGPAMGMASEAANMMGKAYPRKKKGS